MDDSTWHINPQKDWIVDGNPKWNTHKLKAAHLKLETTESE